VRSADSPCRLSGVEARPAHGRARSGERVRRSAPLDRCDPARDKTANVLVETKGSVTRGAVRMTLRLLADYKRFTPTKPRLALLVPEEPRRDLRALLDSEGVGLIWRTEGGYATPPMVLSANRCARTPALPRLPRRAIQLGATRERSERGGWIVGRAGGASTGPTSPMRKVRWGHGSAAFTRGGCLHDDSSRRVRSTRV
jgi:hypothetical protein